MLLGVDETAEWCNTFVVVLKMNEQVRLYLDPVRPNQVLIIPVHRRAILNDIFPKLTNVGYLSLIVTSSRYHNQ